MGRTAAQLLINIKILLEVKRMKKYVAPKMEIVNLRVEERMAGSICTGGCPEDVVYGGVTYYAMAGQTK